MSETKINQNYWIWIMPIISIGITLIGSEIVVRYTTGSFEYNTILTKEGLKHIPYSKGKIIQKEFTTHYQYNSLGLRDTEHNISKGNNKRILLIGDSSVEGLSTEFNETIGQEIQRNTGNEVIILGIGSIGTMREKQLIVDYGLKYNPDEAILLFYANDVYDNLNYRTPTPSKIKNLLRRSQLVIWAYKIIYTSKVSPEFFYVFKTNYTEKEERGWNLTYYSIKDINNILTEKNISFKVIILPYKMEVYNEYEQDIKQERFDYDLNKPNQKMNQICKELNIDCIFALDNLKNSTERVYYHYDQHLNFYGNQIIAGLAS